MPCPVKAWPRRSSDIATAIASGVGHVSAYHLTLEPNTAFHHAPPPLPDDDLAADMQEMVEAAAGRRRLRTLRNLGLRATRASACRHNLNYWTFGDYLGIGAGAHGKLSNHERIWRETRQRTSARLSRRGSARRILHKPNHDRRARPARRIHDERAASQRRLSGSDLFTERTGLPLAAIEKSALAARRAGLLESADGYLRPTALGRRFLNRLLSLFLDNSVT
jgi:coproporphyrinogen III oxidase-like Fe-S oxidoreductase